MFSYEQSLLLLILKERVLPKMKNVLAYMSPAFQSNNILQSILRNTLKNKGASRCHRRTFLSKWFHKEPSTSGKTFCFTKMKEGSSDYKKVSKRWLFKEALTEWFFVEPKRVLLWHHCKEPFEGPVFLRVNVAYQTVLVTFDLVWMDNTHLAIPQTIFFLLRFSTV